MLSFVGAKTMGAVYSVSVGFKTFCASNILILAFSSCIILGLALNDADWTSRPLSTKWLMGCLTVCMQRKLLSHDDWNSDSMSTD